MVFQWFSPEVATTGALIWRQTLLGMRTFSGGHAENGDEDQVKKWLETMTLGCWRSQGNVTREQNLALSLVCSEFRFLSIVV